MERKCQTDPGTYFYNKETKSPNGDHPTELLSPDSYSDPPEDASNLKDLLLSPDSYSDPSEDASNFKDLLLSPDSYSDPPEDASNFKDLNDDKNGHFMFETGSYLANRFKILKELGKGMSAKVVECLDLKLKEMVAIKIFRSGDEHVDELKCHTIFAEEDTEGTYCVRVRNWFIHRGHVCLVMELLGPSLATFLQEIKSIPLDYLNVAKKVGRDLLECVAFLRDNNIIHCDLKPENILFNSRKHADTLFNQIRGADSKHLAESKVIKLIDFSSAVVDVTRMGCEGYSSDVVTALYAAPECMLGLVWSFPSDIWSVGCILSEIAFGRGRSLLFYNKHDIEYLAMMQKLLGPVPECILDSIPLIEKLSREKLKWKLAHWREVLSKEQAERVEEETPHLDDIILQSRDPSEIHFLLLLEGLLRYDPSERLKPRQARAHYFFRSPC